MGSCSVATSRECANPKRVEPGRPDDGADDGVAQAGCDDLDTILAARADPHRFEPLYLRYQPQVHGYCLRRLGHPELAADATSQIFINAIKAIPRFKITGQRVDSRFRSWLFSIAHNVVVDTYRRQRPTVSLDTSNTGGVQLSTLADPDLTPEDAAVAAETSRDLVTQLARLPNRQRAVIELRLAGLSRMEIAEALDLSEAAVRSAQFRGFVTLRQRLTVAPSQRDPENAHEHH